VGFGGVGVVARNRESEKQINAKTHNWPQHKNHSQARDS